MVVHGPTRAALCQALFLLQKIREVSFGGNRRSADATSGSKEERLPALSVLVMIRVGFAFVISTCHCRTSSRMFLRL